MGQMIFEGPVELAVSLGYKTEDYSELISNLYEKRKMLLEGMHKIIDTYENDSYVKGIIKRGIPKEGSYHRGSLVDIVASEGGNSNPVVASASELYYWAGSWQDDIADNNTFRQSAQSIRSFSDDITTSYISNTVFGLVFRAISEELANQAEKSAKIFRYMAKDFHVVHRGQVLDMWLSERSIEEVTVEEYKYLVECTTGADIAAQLAIGATLSELNSDTTQNLYNFGLKLGTLAQMRDDVLDYCDIKKNNRYIIGKLPFRDIESNKRRLPLLLTKDTNMKELPDQVYNQIEEIMKPISKDGKESLNAADMSDDAKRQLSLILNYWSDIRIFQYLKKHEENEKR